MNNTPAGEKIVDDDDLLEVGEVKADTHGYPLGWYTEPGGYTFVG